MSLISVSCVQDLQDVQSRIFDGLAVGDLKVLMFLFVCAALTRIFSACSKEIKSIKMMWDILELGL